MRRQMNNKIRRSVIAVILTAAILITLIVPCFAVGEKVTFFVPSADAADSGLMQTVALAASEFSACGYDVSVTTGNVPPKSDAVIIEQCAGLGDEGYSIDVSGTLITIDYSKGSFSKYYNGASYNGLLYGLRGLLRRMKSGKATSAMGCPEAKERTVMIDIARKYYTVDWLKNFIAQMSWMGYNSLELHMTEEQGARCNIWRDASGKTVYDNNGNDFSFMIGYSAVSWNSTYTDPLYDHFYNRDELAEIITYARDYHIEIIPSVDFPGHSYNLIRRFAEKYAKDGFSFNYGGRTWSQASATGNIRAGGSGSSTIDVSAGYARNLSYAIVDAYADFFGKYGCTKFNIGGDEVVVNDNDWANYAKQNGGSTQYDAFIIYMNSLAELLRKKGYTARAFNDYFDSSSTRITLSDNIEMVCWSTPSSDYGGRKLYNAMGSYTYYALRNNPTYGDARSETNRQWNFHHASAQRIFSGCGGNCGFSDCASSGGWNPSKMWNYNSKTQRTVTGDRLGGGYFLIWGDWAGWDTEANMWNRADSYNLIARMWAAIAKMWRFDGDSLMSYSAFTSSIQKSYYFPGYNGCTSPCTTILPAAKKILAGLKEYTNLVGDADGDGTVTVADARLVLRAAIELDKFTSQQKTLCDTDGDGVISVGDARTVLRTAIGITGG